jgi:glutamyl-tRNA reductase
MIGPTSLHVRSINHKNAPTEVRGKAHLDPDRATALMDVLGGHIADENHVPTVSETGCISVVPVSTCNRTEIYIEVVGGTDVDALLRHGLTEVGADPDLFFSEHATAWTELDAVRHLYHVSAGLESMMLGEPQISAQLKDAYRLARRHHEPGPGLLRAFQGAFRAGKRVRTETRISNGAVSVAFAAVELARKFFDKLSDHRAVLVGAGETGGLAAHHFLQHHIGHLVVVNRSLDNAETLAATLREEMKGGLGKKNAKNSGGLLPPSHDPEGISGIISVQPWEQLTDALAEADVILSTTGATEPVILPEMVEAAVPRRKGKPLFLLDIAVPRDIHPDVAKIDKVFTFGLDDLDGIIQGNLAARAGQVPHAQGIIEEELVEFQQWLDDIDIRPTVAEFKAYLEELKDKQVGFVRKKQSDEVATAVDRSLQQFIKKVVGRSVSTLKSSQTREERERDLETLKRIFAPEERD